MTKEDLERLCELCNELSHNAIKKSICESDIEDNKKYQHLAWVVKKSSKKIHELNLMDKEIIKSINSLFNVTEMIEVIKDCLSYADAQAILKGGEANELREKCWAVIEKVEESNNANI